MATERNKLVQIFFDQTHLYLKKRYGIRLRQHVTTELLVDVKGANILDVGCGDGAISLPLLHNSDNRLTLLDLSDKMLAEAYHQLPEIWKHRVSFYHGDFLAFEPCVTFDVVLSLGVLAHVSSVSATLEKVAKLLKPGGRFVVQFTDSDKWIARLDALYSWGRERLMPNYHYTVNRIRYAELTQQMSQFGLEVKDQRRFSLLVPGMGKLPDSFLFRYQMATLNNSALSVRGSEVILLAEKQPMRKVLQNT